MILEWISCVCETPSEHRNTKSKDFCLTSILFFATTLAQRCSQSTKRRRKSNSRCIRLSRAFRKNCNLVCRQVIARFSYLRLELELLCDIKIQAFERNTRKALRGQSRDGDSRISLSHHVSVLVPIKFASPTSRSQSS